MVTCRDAVAGDEDAIASLFGTLGYSASPDDVRGRLQYVHGTSAGLIVVHDADAILGIASYDMWFAFVEGIHVCRLTSLCVDGTHRKIGIGTQLITEVETRARAAGCSRIELSSGRRNERSDAHHFYSTHEYEEQSAHHVFYGKVLSAEPPRA